MKGLPLLITTAILSTTRPKRLSVSIRCRWFEIQSYDMALYRAREYLTHLSVVVEIDGDAPCDRLGCSGGDYCKLIYD